MKLIRILAQSTLVGASLLGLGILSTRAQSNLPPGAEDMPTGYVLSKTPIAGKHCYHHGGGHVYFYCYSRKINGSEIKQHDAMMKKDNGMMKHDSMMKKDDAMMKHDAMMKKDDGMMKNK
jgi:hypothetical protein